METKRIRRVLLGLGLGLGLAATLSVALFFVTDRFVRGPEFVPVSSMPASAARQGAAPTPRSARRAFYSGHSLSEGVPERVAELASEHGLSFSFDAQNVVGSLLRTRLS